MKIKMRRMAPAALLVILGAGFLPGERTWAEDPSKQSVVFDYADQITRLVESRKIDELAKLSIPATDGQVSKLQSWKSDYVSEIQKQEADRDKQYNDEVTKAQDLLKKEKFDGAITRVVRAYQITKDQEAFLKLDWVKDLTAKVAAGAAELERKGQWLEALELYSDLSSLYEIDTRYKPDMQRVGRRIRLLAMYTPRTLFDMRKELIAKQKPDFDDPATTAPATTPSTQADEEPANFPRWQDITERIQPDMLHDAIERSRNDWVELTSYDTLLRGGVDSLRLFLTTPELAKEFPALGDKAAVESFGKALDGALAKDASGRETTIEDVDRIVKGLIQASDSTVKLPSEVIVMEFTDGAMEKLDPFTAVIWPHEKDEFEKNTRGSFGGVGIQISLEKDPSAVEQAALKKEMQKLENINPGDKPAVLDKDTLVTKVSSKYQLVVITPLPNTPAFNAGIDPGDVIVAIDGKNTVNMSIDQAVHTITGKPGTDVVLTIKRAGEADRDYALTRAEIKVESVKGVAHDPAAPSKWDFMLDQENKIGYIRLTGFQDDTAMELKDALDELQAKGLRGVIMDLRFNPGGLLNSAIDISDMFLTDGEIVSTKGRSHNAKDQHAKAHRNTEIPPTMPVIVLVNQYSASASEIYAGAMKDLHRALIVGHRSFGKGSVQNLLPIGGEKRADGYSDAMMKLTMAYYYLPNKESLHRKDGAKTWGVDPEVVVDITPKQLGDLLKTRRDADIIHRVGAKAPATQPAAKEVPGPDTQLDTALLMMRLQLVQSAP